MNKNSTYRDPQLEELIKSSYPDRGLEEVERFTQQVMHSLPKRKHKFTFARLMTFIQSPFWLIFPLLLSSIVICYKIDYLVVLIENTLNFLITVILITAISAYFVTELLRESDAMSGHSN